MPAVRWGVKRALLSSICCFDILGKAPVSDALSVVGVEGRPRSGWCWRGISSTVQQSRERQVDSKDGHIGLHPSLYISLATGSR